MYDSRQYKYEFVKELSSTIVYFVSHYFMEILLAVGFSVVILNFIKERVI